MKKLAIICNTDGALFNFRRPLIQKHLNDGAIVNTYSNDYDNYFKELKTIGCNPVKINFHVKNNFLENIQLIFTVLKHILKFKPDIIHIYTLQPAILLSIPLFLVGMRNIVTTITGMGRNFDINPNKINLKQRLILMVLKICLKFNKSVIVQNRVDYNMFLKNRIVNKNKLVRTSGSGIEIPDNHNLSMTSTNHYEQNSKKMVLFPARGIKEKGIEIFAEVAKTISSIDNSFEFIHAGSYPEYMSKNEYEEYAKTNNFTPLGYLKNIKKLYLQCHIVFLPSMYREGTPKTLIEAIFFNKIIVTSRIAGCEETVIQGLNGFKGVPGNIHDFVSYIQRTEEISDKQKTNTNKFLLKKYDINKLFELHKNIYEKMLKS